MIEVGRLCIKLAGRDAGRKCVVVDVLEDNLVMIDGETRRRKCNILHLEPLDEKVKISKGASHEAVAKALKELKIEVRTTKPKKAGKRPRRTRKAKKKPAESLEEKAEKPGKKEKKVKEKKPKKAEEKKE